jgi:hypothetical protein
VWLIVQPSLKIPELEKDACSDNIHDNIAEKQGVLTVSQTQTLQAVTQAGRLHFTRAPNNGAKADIAGSNRQTGRYRYLREPGMTRRT